VITQNGEPRAIVMDVASYQRLQDALILLKLIAQSEEALKRGRWSTHSQLMRKVKKGLDE
jgi:PHD/YefM family antitoxin component YafN of YafNO toxin-antitoxin module